MKKTQILLVFLLAANALFAQKKTTTSAIINFDASTALDAAPKAENTTVVAAIDLKDGTIAFEAVVKNFQFENSMMQEHFNGKKWMDSENYPNATYTGKITNLKEIVFTKDGAYKAKIEGELTMHGKTVKVNIPATIIVNGKLTKATADFSVKLEDFDIDGGAIAAGKVSKDPKITVVASF